jgi:hypothetical protein
MRSATQNKGPVAQQPPPRGYSLAKRRGRRCGARCRLRHELALQRIGDLAAVLFRDYSPLGDYPSLMPRPMRVWPAIQLRLSYSLGVFRSNRANHAFRHGGLAQTLFFNVCDLPKARFAEGRDEMPRPPLWVNRRLQTMESAPAPEALSVMSEDRLYSRNAVLLKTHRLRADLLEGCPAYAGRRRISAVRREHSQGGRPKKLEGFFGPQRAGASE